MTKKNTFHFFTKDKENDLECKSSLIHSCVNGIFKYILYYIFYKQLLMNQYQYTQFVN